MAAPTAENVFVPSVKSIPHGDDFASLSSRGEGSGEGPTPASSEANAAGNVATELQTPRGAGRRGAQAEYCISLLLCITSTAPFKSSV